MVNPCARCGKEYDELKDNKKSVCNLCAKNRTKKYREQNKKYIHGLQRDHYIKHQDELKKKQQDYYRNSFKTKGITPKYDLIRHRKNYQKRRDEKEKIQLQKMQDYHIKLKDIIPNINPKIACKIVQCSPCIHFFDSICQQIVKKQDSINIVLKFELYDHILADQENIKQYIKKFNKYLFKYQIFSYPRLIVATSIYLYYQHQSIHFSQVIISQLCNIVDITIRNLIKRIHKR